MYVLTRLLQQNGFAILDCQVASPHLLSLGAAMMPRRTFTALLETACDSGEKCRFWPTESASMTRFLQASVGIRHFRCNPGAELAGPILRTGADDGLECRIECQREIGRA